ncbi:hypothetical protein PEBR_40711 [Penicillium brasilianum]|uniref:Uncharacterized protein n=1 Tax=Penicillium brasilianum TaxID=104259 RepID=A0A1S9RAE3_PENBI|nr:hypothetical protein PEBR_40711 [Penicillium brasilianum]
MHNTINTHPIHEKAPRRGRKTLLAAVAPGTGLPSGTPHMALGMEIGKIGTVGTVGTIGTRPTRSISLFATVLAIPHYTVCITPLWGDTQRFPGLTECGPPAAPSLTMRDFLWGVAERETKRGLLSKSSTQVSPVFGQGQPSNSEWRLHISKLPSTPQAILGLGSTPSLLARTTQPCTYVSGNETGAPIPAFPAISRPNCGQEWVPAHLNQTLTGGPEEHREGVAPLDDRPPAKSLLG